MSNKTVCGKCGGADEHRMDCVLSPSVSTAQERKIHVITRITEDLYVRANGSIEDCVDLALKIYAKAEEKISGTETE